MGLTKKKKTTITATTTKSVGDYPVEGCLVRNISQETKLVL